MGRLRNMKPEDQKQVFDVAMKLFEIRYSESDVVIEHGQNPGEVVESWADCMLIAEQMVEMFKDRCLQ